MLLPLGAFAILGACAPYPPQAPPSTKPQAAPQLTPEQKQQAITDKKQRDLEKRRRLAREKKRREARRREARRREAQNSTPSAPPKPKTPPKPNYPTASSVPGKPGFVFNPYTHNIVDVKGIGSGKLCRDPEDGDSTHKFRVP